MNSSDEVLIRRCQRGEKSAFNELFYRYEGKAFMYAMRMTNHVEDAADVVSEGFIRINRAIGRFQAQASFSTWMYRILKNCFLDIRKKHYVNAVTSLDEGIEGEYGAVFLQAVDPSSSTFDVIAEREHTAQVQKALRFLPDCQRQLILLYYEERLSYEAISKVLKIPAGTVKSRLHRAKINLKSVVLNEPSLEPLASPYRH